MNWAPFDMTPDTKTPETKLRKLHASVLKWRRAPASDFLLSDEDFRFAADCERMRVDRNGSVLSLLLVQLHKQNAKDREFFTRLLEGRLRVTDTPGRLDDGRIAILLPDTSAEGAWKVAADISEIYPTGPSRPECEVLVYPTKKGPTKKGPNKKGPIKKEPNKRSDRDDDSAEGYDSSDELPEELEQEVAGSCAQNGSKKTDEFFFAKSLPLWKRSLDILGGSLGLLASLPILAVAAVTVKATSPGSALFRQQREGQGGKPFTMWKLRTMQVDAEEKKQALRKLSQQDGPAFKMENDPRTTSVGRFLRWTSMDELPQFWNVIRGEMSLVGPRPLPVEESAACESWHRRRLQVRPGMTCTWQVCERGNVSFDDWVRMDLRYAKKLSLLEDMRLLIMTLPSLLMQRGMR